jgi:hypothetical protein
MPTSKEEIRRKYGMTDEDFDVVQALALRPTCKHCNRPLPPDSLEARICSFECTFCATCVEKVLGNVCPNCGGGFAPRPRAELEEREFSDGVPGAYDSEARAGG